MLDILRFKQVSPRAEMAMETEEVHCNILIVLVHPILAISADLVRPYRRANGRNDPTVYDHDAIP